MFFVSSSLEMAAWLFAYGTISIGINAKTLQVRQMYNMYIKHTSKYMDI